MDITQTLGFDASQAIANIALLNQALESLNKILGGTGTAISNWNAIGGAATTQFGNMKTSADAARKAVEALTAATNAAAVSASKVGGAGANKPLTPPTPPDLSAYTKQIESLASVVPSNMQKASEATKRAYANAVTGLVEYASKNSSTAAQINDAWNNNGKVVTGAANVLANKAQAVKTAVANMAQEVEGGASKIGAAFARIGQMAAFQVIHQAINGLINLFKEGVTGAIDFGIRLAEVGTIMGKSFAGQGGLTRQELKETGDLLLSMASTYGGNLTDVTKGYYETLSNQVGNASESMHVFDVAMQLAVSTNTSVEDSVNLLTGALNSYGMSARQAADVSGVLFKSIELGRFHAKDLANILGRVAPISHELGVGFNEMMSALTVMTITGTKADTAITQLRGIETQLLKPTKELKDLFQSKWGVENAQQAIDLFGGLVPMLQAIEKAAGGNITKMAEFFKNVRALTGAIQMGGENAARLVENLEKLNQSGKSLIEWAKEFVLDSDAKKAQIAINNLHIAFVKFGQDALPAVSKALTKFMDLFGTLAKYFQSFAVLAGGVALAGLAPAILSWGTAAGATVFTFTALSTAVKGLLASIGPLGWAILAASTAWGTWTAYQSATAIRSYDEYVLQTNKKAEAEVKFSMEQNALQEQRLQKQLKGQTEFLQSVTSGYALATREIDADIKRKAQSSYEGLKSMMNGLTSHIESALSKIQSAANTTMETIKKAQEAIANRNADLSGKDREQRRKYMSSEDASRDLRLEAQQQLALGAAMRSRATNADELAVAETQVNRGVALFNQLVSGAKTEEESRSAMMQLRNATEELNRVDEKRIENAKTAASAAPQLNASLMEMQTNVIELKKEILDLMNPKTGGKWKPKEQWLSDLNSVEDKIRELNTVMATGPKSGSKESQALGLDKELRAIKQMQADLPAIVLKVSLDVEEARGKFDALVSFISKETQKKLQIDPSNFTSSFSASVERVNKEITDANKGLNTYSERMESVGIKGREAKVRIDELTVSLMQRANSMVRTDTNKWSTIAESDMAKGYISLINNMKTLATAELSEEARTKRLTALRKEMFDFEAKNKDVFGSGKFLTSLGATAMETMAQQTRVREQELANMKEGLNRKDLQQKRNNAEKERQLQLQVGKEAYNQLMKTKQGQEALDRLSEQKTSMSNEAKATASGLDTATTASDRLGSSIDSNIQKMNQLAAASQYAASSMPQTAAMGGLIRHLATGGPSGIGTDTVPAMLTPGEFVMNTKATSRFFSQLVAMNAGTTPQGRATGGPITNFGDINVSVNGSGGSRQTARDIGAALRRELRRGTSSLG